MIEFSMSFNREVVNSDVNMQLKRSNLFKTMKMLELA